MGYARVLQFSPLPLSTRGRAKHPRACASFRSYSHALAAFKNAIRDLIDIRASVICTCVPPRCVLYPRAFSGAFCPPAVFMEKKSPSTGFSPAPPPGARFLPFFSPFLPPYFLPFTVYLCPHAGTGNSGCSVVTSGHSHSSPDLCPADV